MSPGEISIPASFSWWSRTPRFARELDSNRTNRPQSYFRSFGRHRGRFPSRVVPSPILRRILSNRSSTDSWRAPRRSNAGGSSEVLESIIKGSFQPSCSSFTMLRSMIHPCVFSKRICSRYSKAPNQFLRSRHSSDGRPPFLLSASIGNPGSGGRRVSKVSPKGSRSRMAAARPNRVGFDSGLIDQRRIGWNHGPRKSE